MSGVSDQIPGGFGSHPFSDNVSGDFLSFFFLPVTRDTVDVGRDSVVCTLVSFFYD
jgi:hypothetical protein